MDKIEKLIKKRRKELNKNLDKLTLSDIPELNKNDITYFLNIFKKHNWKIEEEIDLDGTVFLDIYPDKDINISYSYSFNEEGYLSTLYSDYEHLLKQEWQEEAKSIKKLIQDDNIKISELPELFLQIEEFCDSLIEFGKD